MSNFSGVALAYSAAGLTLAYSGIKGATVADTVKSLLSGNLNVSDTETVTFPDTSSSSSGSSGSSSTASSGSASANYLTIGKYLVSNGYSAAGAAGVVGCIAGESSGNPEAVEDSGSPGSGGEGLIQWTPGSKYGVPITGNATKDLQAQLPMIISYNNAQGAGLVKMLNAQTDPVQAADFYSQHFERPAVTDSDVNASVAQSVYSQLKGGS